VLQRIPGLFLSVSATTRRPRPVERDGVDYVFVTADLEPVTGAMPGTTASDHLPVTARIRLR